MREEERGVRGNVRDRLHENEGLRWGEFRGKRPWELIRL